jgi:hypothetical protein
MTRTHVRRSIAVGASLAVMAVGGSYATGAFALSGSPTHAPANKQDVPSGQSVSQTHPGQLKPQIVRGKHLSLGHATAADPADDPTDGPSDEPSDQPSEDPGDDAQGDENDQGDQGDQNDQGDDQGDQNEQGDDQGDQNDQGVESGDQGDQGGDSGDNGGDQGGDNSE